jgi:hypothetical protein
MQEMLTFCCYEFKETHNIDMNKFGDSMKEIIAGVEKGIFDITLPEWTKIGDTPAEKRANRDPADEERSEEAR